MNRKIIATLLALSMLSSTAIAYGNVQNEEGRGGEVVEELNQGVPEGSGEVLSDGVVSQGSGGLEGVPGGSRSVSEGVGNLEQEVVITDGSVNFGNSSIAISNYNSVDYPGTFSVDVKSGTLAGAPVRLTNTGETELVIYAEKCKSMDSTSPRIVAPITFSDWTSLTKEETLSYMALGFKINGNTAFWFADEDNQQTQEVYRLQPGEAITFEITGRCGTQWPNSCNINYDCTIGLEVIPLTKIIEQPAADEETPEVSEVPEQVEQVEQPEAAEETPDVPEQFDTETIESTETAEDIEETEVLEQVANPDQANGSDKAEDMDTLDKQQPEEVDQQIIEQQIIDQQIIEQQKDNEQVELTQQEPEQIEVPADIDLESQAELNDVAE